LKIIKNKLGNIFENDSNKFDVKDKTSESPLLALHNPHPTKHYISLFNHALHPPCTLIAGFQ
jgi:hypothetical protein